MAVKNNPPKQRIAVVGTLAETMLGFRADLINEMVNAGHEVFAFATDYSVESRAAVKALGAEPVCYQLGRLSLNPCSEIKAIFQLYRLFKHYRISTSFCYFAKPVIYGTFAAWMAGVPYRVAKIEGLGRAFTIPAKGSSVKGLILRRVQVGLYQLSLPLAHHIFLLNPDDKKDLLENYRISGPKVTILNGIGVNLQRYPEQPFTDTRLRFIFIGRLLNEKGIRYFVDAAKIIKQQHPDVEFVVLGETDSGKYALTRAELNTLTLHNIIVHPGKVNNIAQWLASSSVFVLPSYYREGVPRSTQEALASGRAIITTDMPGCRQTVQHGINGFLIPAHDQVALQNAMLKFIENPDIIAPMGRFSRLLAEKQFDVKDINKRIMNLMSLSNDN